MLLFLLPPPLADRSTTETMDPGEDPPQDREEQESQCVIVAAILPGPMVLTLATLTRLNM